MMYSLTFNVWKLTPLIYAQMHAGLKSRSVSQALPNLTAYSKFEEKVCAAKACWHAAAMVILAKLSGVQP